MHAGSFRVSVIHWTLTWTTGSLTSVRDHSCACVYTRGLGTPATSQHNTFDSEKLTHFSCAPDRIRTSVLWILSHPVTPKYIPKDVLLSLHSFSLPLSLLSWEYSNNLSNAVQERRWNNRSTSIKKTKMMTRSYLNTDGFFNFSLNGGRCSALSTSGPLPLKGGRGFLMSPPLSGISGRSIWSYFSISPLLLFCLVLLLFLSYPFLLLAYSPDFFFPKPPFSER